jgi:hypothetical protein
VEDVEKEEEEEEEEEEEGNNPCILGKTMKQA